MTAPSSGLSAGAVSLSASAGYDGSSRRLLQTATVNEPSTSLAATFNNTAITDNSDPSPTSLPGEPDNTVAEGQTIAVSGTGTSLGFLAAANNSAESGTGTIYYTVGTTDWVVRLSSPPLISLIVF